LDRDIDVLRQQLNGMAGAASDLGCDDGRVLCIGRAAAPRYCPKRVARPEATSGGPPCPSMSFDVKPVTTGVKRQDAARTWALTDLAASHPSSGRKSQSAP
jgi:hypothetical protein